MGGMICALECVEFVCGLTTVLGLVMFWQLSGCERLRGWSGKGSG